MPTAAQLTCLQLPMQAAAVTWQRVTARRTSGSSVDSMRAPLKCQVRQEEVRACNTPGGPPSAP